MKSENKKRLNIVLKLFLYFILGTGVIETLAIYGVIPQCENHLWGSLHITAGFIFMILVGWHLAIYRKWYKAWFTRKLKGTNSRLTKLISLLFFLMLFSIFSEELLPENVFICIHILISSLWIAGIILHFRSKKRSNVKSK
jgi:hypothetical protein